MRQNEQQPRIPRLATLAVMACLAAVSTQARAQNLLTNGSFENTAGTFVNNGQGYMDLGVGATTIPGWTVTNNAMSWLSNTNTPNITTPAGSFFLDLTGSDDSAPYGGVTQTIATNPGGTYTLSLSLGLNRSNAAYNGTKSVSVTAGSLATTFTLTPLAGAGDQWSTFSSDFTATAASTAITIIGTSPGTGGAYIGLDNVSVTPEPTTLSALGAMAVALTRRRRR